MSHADAYRNHDEFKLPYTVPGGQQVQFTPYQIGGKGGGDAVVVGSGSQRSENFSAGSAGWKVNGSGSVEFESGTFRGDISGADGAFAGTMSASNLTVGTINAAVIDVQNITANNIKFGTLDGDLVTVTKVAAEEIVAGTLTSMSIAGGSIDIGGADTTSFHVDTAGKLWLGASTWVNGPFRVDATGNLYMGGTNTTAPFKVTTAGAVTATDVTISGKLASVTMDTGGYLQSITYTSGLAGWRINAGGTAEFAGLTTNGLLIIEDGLCSGTIQSAVLQANGNVQASFVSGEYRVRMGVWGSGGLAGYYGIFHDSTAGLADGYLIMTDGNDTYIGSDVRTYIRPVGNGGGSVTFQATGGTNQCGIRVGNGTIVSPSYGFLGDTDSGFFLATNDDIRLGIGTGLAMRWTAGHIYAGGMAVTSGTSQAVYRSTTTDNEIFAVTSSIDFKQDVADLDPNYGRKLLDTRLVTWSAMMQERDGRKWITDPGKTPRMKGQQWAVPGFIAEETAIMFPEITLFDDDDVPVGVDEHGVVAALVSLCQDMHARLLVLEGV